MTTPRILVDHQVCDHEMAALRAERDALLAEVGRVSALQRHDEKVAEDRLLEIGRLRAVAEAARAFADISGTWDVSPRVEVEYHRLCVAVAALDAAKRPEALPTPAPVVPPERAREGWASIAPETGDVTDGMAPQSGVLTDGRRADMGETR